GGGRTGAVAGGAGSRYRHARRAGLLSGGSCARTRRADRAPDHLHRLRDPAGRPPAHQAPAPAQPAAAAGGDRRGQRQVSAGKANGKRTTPPVRRPGGLAGKAAGLGGWAESLRRLAGWRQLGLAALLGALAAGALPPLYLVPLLVPAFVGLVWLLEGCAGWRRAFLVGWAF